MTGIITAGQLSNNVTSVGSQQAADAINRASGIVAITLPDSDYTLTEAESGYGAYVFIGSALTAPRTVTLDPAYNWESDISAVNLFGTDTITLKFDGGSVTGDLLANESSGFMLYAAGLSVLKVAPNAVLPTQTITGAHTATAADHDVTFICTGTFTFTLPAVADVPDGYSLTILNKGLGVITVDGDGAETINGSTTIPVNAAESRELISDATEWWVK